MKYFFRYLIPWKIIFFCLIFVSCFATITALVNNPSLIPDKLLRESVIISLTTSIIGSGIFLFLLRILKPSIIISKKIAYSDKYLDTLGHVYFIKVINNSWFFDIQDVSVKMQSYQEYPHSETEEKYNYRREGISMVNPYLNIIDSRLKNGIKNRTASYAQLFGTRENLDDVFEDNKSIIVEVYAKHSLSGFSRIEKRKYNLAGCIKPGMFGHGDNFVIS